MKSKGSQLIRHEGKRKILRGIGANKEPAADGPSQEAPEAQNP